MVNLEMELTLFRIRRLRHLVWVQGKSAVAITGGADQHVPSSMMGL